MKEVIKPAYWGFNFTCQENIEAFTHWLLLANGKHIEYLEIGLGNCGTINAVDLILRQWGISYRLTGVDIEEWTYRYLMPQGSRVLIGGRDVIPKGELFNFVFIDGCHCLNCVLSDFSVIEPLVAVGGVVCFHDTNPECQGEMAAPNGPHSEKGIQVLEALEKLGLMVDKPCMLEGWRHLGGTPGHAPINGCEFYQNTS